MPLIAGLLALVAAVPALPPPTPDGGGGVEIAQLMFRSRVVIRVQTELPPGPPKQERLREKKGPRCIAMADIGGAAVTGPASVDFFLRGGQRIRAHLTSRCPSLAFYSGFYVAPSPDGQLCAGRETVRDRAGGECEVAKLKRIVPKH